MEREKGQGISGQGSVVMKLFPEELTRYRQRIANLGENADIKLKEVEVNPTVRGGLTYYEFSGDRRLINKLFEPQTQEKPLPQNNA